ncbi:MAG: hypothetical protein DRI46_06660 [Chloroflexi bacterium]|nr:MAG: hypothetical protein DRI46_06660 [Chloroflexota bacterium]
MNKIKRIENTFSDRLALSEDLLEDGMPARSGLNQDQAVVLGISWPLSKGWKKKIVDSDISVDSYHEFLRLKGRRLKKHK